MPTTDRPMHIETQGAFRAPGDWFPCEAPERPWDGFTCVHDCCPSCLIAVEAAIARGDDDGIDLAALRDRMDLFGPAPRLAVAE